MITSEIKFIDISPRSGRIPDGYISVTHRTKGTEEGKCNCVYQTTFNTQTSQYILDKGCKFVRIGINQLTSETFIVFSRKAERFAKPINVNAEYKNIVIASKAVTEELLKVSDLQPNEHGNYYGYIRISADLSRTDEVATYKINP